VTATSTGSPAAPAIAPAPFRLTQLESGLRVITEAIPSVRSAALAFWIGTGSLAETDGEAGLSHLLEHMLFRGTDRFGSEEIDRIFDAMGAELNAGTGKDSTSLYTRVLDGHLERALEVMSDMIWRPGMGELEAEREVVLEEIAMYEDDPQDRVFDLLGEAVFPGHPLGRAIVGRAEVVAGAQRDVLTAFHAGRYLPQNIVLAAAGSVDHERLVSLASESAAANGRRPPQLPAPPPPSAPVVRFLTKDTEQYHVCVGAPGIARDDDRRFALRVLDNILGGTSSSRLFQEVRERRGLAYSIFSFTGLYAGTGQVGVYLGTRPENLVESLEVVGAEIERFVADPATDEELVRSRENVKGRTVLSLESTSTRMNRLGSALLADMPVLSLDEVIDRIDAVTLDDVRALAGELFEPARLSAAGIGPDEQAFRKSLAPVSATLPGAGEAA
jgi:predicted Zn-dependent peptidase